MQTIEISFGRYVSNCVMSFRTSGDMFFSACFASITAIL